MMVVTWTWAALPGLVAFALALTIATIVLRAGPRRAVNARLAAVLVTEGLLVGILSGLVPLVGDGPLIGAVAIPLAFALSFTYLSFLGTLDTPIVAWTRPRRVTWTLVIVGVIATGVLEFVPDSWVTDLFWALWTFSPVVTSLFGIVAATDSLRRAARGTAARARAKAFLAAFLLRDIIWAAVFLAFPTPGPLSDLPTLRDALRTWGPPLVVLAYMPLLAYGILRTQLFDIDLRLKRSIRRSTAIGVLLLAFVGVALVAQTFVGPNYGWMFGAASAGVLLFALAPLERAGGRVADAMMPDVHETPEYVNRKKLEIYRAALEEALREDGTLTSKDRAVLARLRGELGVTERDHAIIEMTLAGAAAPSRSGAAASVMEPGAMALGKYRVERLLAKGGQGSTYLAQDVELHRHVVIKSFDVGGDTAESVLKEARAIAALRDARVVTLLDVARVGERAFLVMEHVEGGSLRDRLSRGPLSRAEFETVGVDLLAALESVHAARMVHRDVKPSNVLLSRDGHAKLADFGIARVRGAETTAGVLVGFEAAAGTARYMSPEQAKGRLVTAKSDLYSAGLTLYEAWSGAPYLESRDGESAVELQMRAARASAFDRAIDAAPRLRAWFATALAPSPDERFASARVMREALVAALVPDA